MFYLSVAIFEFEVNLHVFGDERTSVLSCYFLCLRCSIRFRKAALTECKAPAPRFIVVSIPRSSFAVCKAPAWIFVFLILATASLRLKHLQKVHLMPWPDGLRRRRVWIIQNGPEPKNKYAITRWSWFVHMTAVFVCVGASYWRNDVVWCQLWHRSGLWSSCMDFSRSLLDKCCR